MPTNYTPKSELQLQYEREYRRITQAIRRQKKLGYTVPEELKPVSPSKVKVFSPAEVERLTTITPQRIRKESFYVDPQSGEALEGYDVVEKRKRQKKPKAPKQKKRRKKDKQPKPQKKRKRKEKEFEPPEPSAPPRENTFNLQIIADITRILEGWQPQYHWSISYAERKATYRNVIYDKWMQAIENEGEYGLAFRLENKADYYHDLISRVVYASDAPWEDQANLTEIITFLTGQALTAEESDRYSSEAYDYLRDNFIGDSFG